jgi:hypothetical protein
MKAAPEKIYMTPSYGEPDNVLLASFSKSHLDFHRDIEYTRTDAFMKKAENFLEMLGYGFTITDNITHANYDKEQLIADFRNYIEKGEKI